MTEIVDLAEKLKNEGDKLIRAFSELSVAQWQVEVYTEGETWTVCNILSHFVTSESGLVKLFESIRQGGMGANEDFSIDRFNAKQQEITRGLSPAELLKQYHLVRCNSVNWVRGLKAEELLIVGRHPFLGETTLREMIKMVYLHNQIHYRDLKKVLI